MTSVKAPPSVLEAGVNAYVQHFAGKPPANRDALEQSLADLPAEVQQPIFQALWFFPYDTFSTRVTESLSVRDVDARGDRNSAAPAGSTVANHPSTLNRRLGDNQK